MRVVIAGGGLAGLTAALRATELGAQATLLEKGAGPGGSFVYSSGYIWSYVDLPTFRREAPGGDAILQRLIFERLGSCLAWLEGAGGVLIARETGNPLTFGARFDPERTVSALVDRLEATGGEILTETAFEALLEDSEGRVTGVRVSSSGDDARCGRRDPCLWGLRRRPRAGRAPHNRGTWKDAGAGAPEEYGRRFSGGAAEGRARERRSR